MVGFIFVIGQLTDSSGEFVEGRVWEDILFDVQVGSTPEEGTLVHVLVSLGCGVIKIAEAHAEVSVKVNFEGVNISVLIPVAFFSQDCDFSHVRVAQDFLELPLGEHPIGLFRCKVFTLSSKGKACDNSN